MKVESVSSASSISDLKCGSCHRDVIVDTGVCSVPKGAKEGGALSYQTYCSHCDTVGSVVLDQEQLKQIIELEEFSVMDILAV